MAAELVVLTLVFLATARVTGDGEVERPAASSGVSQLRLCDNVGGDGQFDINTDSCLKGQPVMSGVSELYCSYLVRGYLHQVNTMVISHDGRPVRRYRVAVRYDPEQAYGTYALAKGGDLPSGLWSCTVSSDVGQLSRVSARVSR